MAVFKLDNRLLSFGICFKIKFVLFANLIFLFTFFEFYIYFVFAIGFGFIFASRERIEKMLDVFQRLFLCLRFVFLFIFGDFNLIFGFDKKKKNKHFYFFHHFRRIVDDTRNCIIAQVYTIKMFYLKMY